MLKADAEALLKEKEDTQRALETYKLMHAYEAAATPLRCVLAEAAARP